MGAESFSGLADNRLFSADRTSKHIFVYSDSASRNSGTLLIRQIYTRWLEARDRRSAGGQRPLWRPEAFCRAKPCRRRTLRLAYSFSRQALANPCRRRTLRLGRRPTVQRQSTGTALPS